MKIKIQDGCKSVNNRKVKIGDVVETDANTARNLIVKGYATPADKDAENINLEAKSTLTRLGAQANITNIIAMREKYAAQQKEQARLAAAGA